MRKIMFGTHVLVDLDELADKYTKEEIDNMISTVFVYKGTVATTEDLNNIENPKVGDCWNVEADGSNYAWNGSEWDKLGGTVDLSNYYTKTQVDSIKSALELQIQSIETLPTGGTEGQILTKNSNTNGDASWKSFNSLVFKGHVDTPDDLPNLGQPSGTLIVSSYDYTNRFNILKTSCNIKNEIGALADKIALAKENHTYYIGINGSANSIYAIGTNYPEIVKISHDNKIVIKGSEDKTAGAYYYNGNYNVSSLIDETYEVPVIISSSINWIETNIPSIGIDTSTYNTFAVTKDDGSTYYYNDGMTLLGTSGGTSYVVTDNIPEDLKPYNFYTIGSNNDMYVFNGNTFDIFSKSKVPSGGTTGQVLSKNSDTDDDTSWKSLPNSLSIKDHIDSEDELPIITQGSGTLSSSNYILSTTGLVNNLNKKTIDLPENLASSVNTYKSQYKYYFIFYHSNTNGCAAIFTNNYNILGLDNSGYIVGIDNDENSKVLSYSSEDSITESTIIKKSNYMDINYSRQSLYFETNIPNITAYSTVYDSFSYEIDVNEETYYYNIGMSIISTFNGTSYLVTNEVPDIQINYNEIYTVGNYYDLYVIDEKSLNWICYSKSRIPKGGIKGQILSKKENEDYATEWIDSGDPSTGILSAFTFLDATENTINLDNYLEKGKLYFIKGNKITPSPRTDSIKSAPFILVYNDNSEGTHGLSQLAIAFPTLSWGKSTQPRCTGLSLSRRVSPTISSSWTNSNTPVFSSSNYWNSVVNSGYDDSTALSRYGAYDLFYNLTQAIGTGTGNGSFPRLNTLQTTDKTSLIAAINEVHNSNVVTSLWTNSSPTTSLAPGNITLSSSTDDYDSIEFIFTDYMETNNYLSVTVPKGKNVNLSCNLYFADLMHYCSRIITYVNATTYDVKDGYNTSNTDPSSPVLHNDCCILQEIRGHKVIKSS